jgi:hypothetical protein
MANVSPMATRMQPANVALVIQAKIVKNHAMDFAQGHIHLGVVRIYQVLCCMVVISLVAVDTKTTIKEN